MPSWAHSERGDPARSWRRVARQCRGRLQPNGKAAIGAETRWALSKAGSSFGLRTESLTKRITYLAPTVSYRMGDDSMVEAALRISLGGRNFPAGNQLIVGLSTSADAG